MIIGLGWLADQFISVTVFIACQCRSANNRWGFTNEGRGSSKKMTLLSNMIFQKNCNVHLGNLFSTQCFLKTTIFSNIHHDAIAQVVVTFFLLTSLRCSPTPRSGNCPPMLRGNAGGIPEMCASKGFTLQSIVEFTPP